MEPATTPLAAAQPNNKNATSASSSIMGKHKMAAAISHLNQQIQIIQDELDLLETIGGASTVCPEIISRVESVPDPLLRETRGPVDMVWDRWFQRAHSSRSHRRWI